LSIAELLFCSGRTSLALMEAFQDDRDDSMRGSIPVSPMNRRECIGIAGDRVAVLSRKAGVIQPGVLR
jgi:hypothetical protein